MVNQRKDNMEEKPQIKLNRKRRMWHKYKNYCFIGGAAIIAIIIVAVILKSCQGGNADNKEIQQPTTQSETQQPTASQETVTQSQESETQTQQETDAPEAAEKAEVVTFEQKAAFDDAVFIGDSIVSGISYYGFLDDSKVIANNNMTSNQVEDYIDQAMSSNPGKVFIMVGLNDANYGNRTSDYVVEKISGAVSKIKAKNASTKVYVLSVLPVTKSFESKDNVGVSQSFIDEVNKGLSEKAASMNAEYIDVASSYKDSEGYMMSDCTGNGFNLNTGYYPFMLNKIAGAVK